MFSVISREPGQPQGEGLLPGAHREGPLPQGTHRGLARASLTQDGGTKVNTLIFHFKFCGFSTQGKT